MTRLPATLLTVFALLLMGADKKPEQTQPAERNAEEALKQLGAQVTSENGEIVSVWFQGGGGDAKSVDASLKHLAGLRRLSSLGLGNTPVTDAGLAPFRPVSLRSSRYSSARPRSPMPACPI